MTDILHTIAANTAERVKARKAVKPLADLISETEVVRNTVAGSPCSREFCFEQALRKEGLSFICEVKKASPSRGVLEESFPYLQIAGDYEEAGADAISVLTEPRWFLGCDSYLQEIRKKVHIPVLRKDFTVDPYQIYEAKLLGADAILLICALLDRNTLTEYLRTARELGLSALTEVHTEAEVHAALEAGAEIIGVNNRDLKTFRVDIGTSIRLRSYVPQNILYVAESGIKTPEDIALLKLHGVDAVLIGETLMKSEDKKQMLTELKRISIQKEGEQKQ